MINKPFWVGKIETKQPALTKFDEETTSVHYVIFEEDHKALQWMNEKGAATGEVSKTVYSTTILQVLLKVIIRLRLF